MKKLWSFLLALSLIMSCVPVVADSNEAVPAPARNIVLDYAFDQGDLTLVQTSFPPVMAESFEIPDDAWVSMQMEKPENPAVLIEPFVAEGNYSWVSLSPSGQSGILSVAGGSAGVCYHDGKYHPLYPSISQGVEDTYGNLSRFSSLAFRNWLGREGVIYSPDERYACIINNDMVLQRALYQIDPIIVDLSTGELILTATYGNNLSDKAVGAVVSATFSSDGRYLYYMLLARGHEYRTALYRYDLLQNQTEFCYSGSDYNYYPNLIETGDSTLLVLRDGSMRKDASSGITEIKNTNGAWTGKEYSFGFNHEGFVCTNMSFSGNSGFALISERTIMQRYSNSFLFQIVQPQESFEGLDQYCIITKENPRIQTRTAEEIADLTLKFANGMQNSNEVSSTLSTFPYQQIEKLMLSPDGHYALILAFSYEMDSDSSLKPAKHLYLLRLDDLSLKAVQGLDPAAIVIKDLTYQPVMEWNTDTLIINTENGIQAWRFQ